MARYITVRMTIEQAMELLDVAGNGYGDGDFYGLNDPEGKDRGYGGKRGANKYHAAVSAIKAAISKSHPEGR